MVGKIALNNTAKVLQLCLLSVIVTFLAIIWFEIDSDQLKLLTVKFEHLHAEIIKLCSLSLKPQKQIVEKVGQVITVWDWRCTEKKKKTTNQSFFKHTLEQKIGQFSNPL